ncbi:MAG: T9SS type A sorting domain-containing protein [Ignavibacteria bacterium]|nr:T9SS type A sorting domain-containing protein [Ignavibacteria bacterium]
MADHLRINIQHLVRNMIFTALLITALMLKDAEAQTANTDMAVTDGNVRAIVVDGNYTYIGGDFTYVGTSSGRGAKATTTNSSIDSRYPKVNAQVMACISDGSGGWYIGGDFTAVGTSIRNRIAHIKSDGSLDLTWNPNASGIAVYTLLLNGTDLYVGGSFTAIGGQSRRYIAKLSTTGTGVADPTWDPNPDNFVRCLLLNGTDLYVGGSFFAIGGQSRRNIAKLSTTGTGVADPTWDPNSNGSVRCILLDGSDLFVGGLFSSIGGQNRNRIAKLSTTGTGVADPTWNPSPSDNVTSMILNGTELFIGGVFTTVGGQNRNRIAKLSTTGAGAADPTWNPGANNLVNCFLLSGTDLFVGGEFTAIGGTGTRYLAKLSTTGTGVVDETWNAGLSGGVLSIASYNNQLYFAGNFNSVNASAKAGLARVDNTTGAVDPDWDPGMNGPVYALAISGSSIYAGGVFTSVNITSLPATRKYLAKFTTSSPAVVDPDWDPGMNGSVYALAINGSSIYAGGNFFSVNGSTSRTFLAKFPLSGTAITDPDWDPSVNSTVQALAIDGSSIYVGGGFTTVNAGVTTRNYLARFPLSGNATVDQDWNPNMDNAVQALASDGSFIYTGGYFTTVNGGLTTRNYLAKFPLSGNATVDQDWNPNVNGVVSALAISGSSIYAGGGFFTVNGGSTSRNGIARFNMVTGLVEPWNANASAEVLALAVSSNDVYVGGRFTLMGGKIQPYLALFTDRALPVELVSFTASITKGVVNLNWHTATEIDNNGFEVQRAVAGSGDWKKIGFIQGHHTTNSPKYYSFTDNPSVTDANKYKYRLKQLDNSGSHEYSNIIEVSLGVPTNFLLEQNYPNPFNPSTVIRYQLPVSGMITIDLYNATGEKVATLLNETEEAGVHSLSFDAVKYGLSSGIYFYRMTVVPASGEVFSSVRKLSLIK